MEEENKKEEFKYEEPKQKSNKVFVIVIVIIAMALTFGCGIILGQKLFEGNEENKNTSKEDKNTVVDNNTINDNTNNNGEIEEVNVDNEIKSLYEKFRRVVYSDCYGYENEKYEINESMVTKYSQEIFKVILEKLNVEKKKESTDYIRNLVKEEFRNYFGKNVTITDNVFWDDEDEQELNGVITGGYSIDYNNGKYEINLRGGTACPEDTLESKLTKAEKDDKNIYLYEDVTVNEKDEEGTILNTSNYTYKWTYDLQEDGNYYFLKAERVK